MQPGRIVFIIALLFAHAHTALAQEPLSPPDGRYVILTNDGSRYEGQLVERVVNGHVTIQLVTGEVRTFPLTDVKAEGPAGQMTPLGVGPTLFINPGFALTGVPLAYHGSDEVAIHLTSSSNGGGNLYHESASGWEVVCEMPCTTTVDPKGTYKIHNADPFRFPGGSKSLDLVADIGSSQRRAAWGLGLITTSMIGGSVLVPFGFMGMLGGDSKTVGWTIVGVSTALIVTGITLLAVGPTSTLTTTSGVRVAKQPSVHLVGSLSLTPSGLVF